MKKKYFGGYLSLRQMLYVIASVITIGILFIPIVAIIKIILFLFLACTFIAFAFVKIGNIYLDKYFLNIVRYFFRKKKFIFER